MFSFLSHLPDAPLSTRGGSKRGHLVLYSASLSTHFRDVPIYCFIHYGFIMMISLTAKPNKVTHRRRSVVLASPHEAMACRKYPRFAGRQLMAVKLSTRRGSMQGCNILTICPFRRTCLTYCSFVTMKALSAKSTKVNHLLPTVPVERHVRRRPRCAGWRPHGRCLRFARHQRKAGKLLTRGSMQGRLVFYAPFFISYCICIVVLSR